MISKGAHALEEAGGDAGALEQEFLGFDYDTDLQSLGSSAISKTPGTFQAEEIMFGSFNPEPINEVIDNAAVQFDEKHGEKIDGSPNATFPRQ